MPGTRCGPGTLPAPRLQGRPNAPIMNQTGHIHPVQMVRRYPDGVCSGRTARANWECNFALVYAYTPHNGDRARSNLTERCTRKRTRQSRNVHAMRGDTPRYFRCFSGGELAVGRNDFGSRKDNGALKKYRKLGLLGAQGVANRILPPDHLSRSLPRVADRGDPMYTRMYMQPSIGLP